jgi:hypothetical protein
LPFIASSAVHDIERRTVRRGKLDSRSLGTRPTELQPLVADQAELVICDQTIERSFGWLARFRRLSRDYERLPGVLRGLHFLVFAMLMLPKAMPFLATAGSS